MARLCEARHFYLNMKKSLFIFLAFAFALVSCNRAPRNYGEAEQRFVASLTQQDTVEVLKLGRDVMLGLRNGEADAAFSGLYMLDGDELHPIDSASLSTMVQRFSGRPVRSYMISGLHFSTAANNDLSFRYSSSDNIGNGSALKLMFNPVKVDGKWYLTLKNAFASSSELSEKSQIKADAPVPAPVKLVLD